MCKYYATHLILYLSNFFTVQILTENFLECASIYKNVKGTILKEINVSLIFVLVSTVSVLPYFLNMLFTQTLRHRKYVTQGQLF